MTDDNTNGVICPEPEVLKAISARLDPFIDLTMQETPNPAEYDKLVDKFIAEGITFDEGACLLMIAEKDIDEMYSDAAKRLISFIDFRTRGLALAEAVSKLRPH
jgi:hypothetical protein